MISPSFCSKGVFCVLVGLTQVFYGADIYFNPVTLHAEQLINRLTMSTALQVPKSNIDARNKLERNLCLIHRIPNRLDLHRISSLQNPVESRFDISNGKLRASRHALQGGRKTTWSAPVLFWKISQILPPLAKPPSAPLSVSKRIAISYLRFFPCVCRGGTASSPRVRIPYRTRIFGPGK